MEKLYRRKKHITLAESDLESDNLMTSSELLEKLRNRMIKSFMDILVLTEIKKSPLSGYDVMRLLHKRFDTMVSSGTVYNLLYSLEREGLVKGTDNARKRVYTLTEKGENNIEVITKTNQEIQNFLRDISLLNATQRSPSPK